MVNKKLVVISYCCIFLFIYFCAIAYAVVPTYMNKAFNSNIDLPKSESMTFATNAASSINTSTLGWFVVIVIIIIIILFTMGSFTMFSAY